MPGQSQKLDFNILNHDRHISHSPEDTWRIAGEIVAKLPDRAFIAMHGELGSGKTCFVQGMALALGIDQPVVSPTFTIVREYKGKRPLFHIDLYRLSDPDEILAFGFDEYIQTDGITAVEWAERAGDLIPADALHIRFEALIDPNDRSIVVVSSE